MRLLGNAYNISVSRGYVLCFAIKVTPGVNLIFGKCEGMEVPLILIPIQFIQKLIIIVS